MSATHECIYAHMPHLINFFNKNTCNSTLPGVVVAVVEAQGVAVARDGLLKVLVGDIPDGGGCTGTEERVGGDRGRRGGGGKSSESERGGEGEGSEGREDGW